jgi:hypothetical protein
MKSKYTDENKERVIRKELSTPEGCKRLLDAMSFNDEEYIKEMERIIQENKKRKAEGKVLRDLGKSWLYR